VQTFWIDKLVLQLQTKTLESGIAKLAYFFLSYVTQSKTIIIDKSNIS